jgi:peptidyl-prolyl cis-trans isomerase B (cyclophilin B)
MCLLLSSTALSQSGKPLYSISVTRGGVPLGTIELELYPDIAPLHVANFDSLVSIGFYDGAAFHRVVPGFVIQGGDPNSKNGPRETWGYGDPSQTTVPAEFSRLQHKRGCLSAARTSDPNSATSQFFICVATASHLDGKYSIYGRVVRGMEVVDTIVSSPRDSRDNPLEKVEMQIVRTGIDESIPGTTMQVMPDDGATGITPASTLTWTAADGGILYQLQISEDPDFTTTVIDTLVPGGPFTLSTIKRGHKTYYWRLRATNGGRRGEFSGVRSFMTAIAIPTLVYPASNGTVDRDNAELRWNRVEGATGYNVQVSTSNTFSSLEVDARNYSDTSMTLNDLTATRYFWRVSAVAGSEETPVSGSRSFNIRTSSVEIPRTGNISGTKIMMSDGELVGVEIHLAAPATLHLLLNDMQGNTVGRMPARHLDGGSHRIAFDTGELPSGLYLLTIGTGSDMVTEPVMILR